MADDKKIIAAEEAVSIPNSEFYEMVSEGSILADRITTTTEMPYSIRVDDARADDIRFVSANGRAMVIIQPTESGFDVTIPEDVTMTEAAQQFIRCVKSLLGQETAE